MGTGLGFGNNTNKRMKKMSRVCVLIQPLWTQVNRYTKNKKSYQQMLDLIE